MADVFLLHLLLLRISLEESYVVAFCIIMESYGVVIINVQGQKTRNALLIDPSGWFTLLLNAK